MKTYRFKIKYGWLTFVGFPGKFRFTGDKHKVSDALAVIEEHLPLLVIRGLTPGVIWHEGIGGFVAKIKEDYTIIPVYPGLGRKYPTSLENVPDYGD